ACAITIPDASRLRRNGRRLSRFDGVVLGRPFQHRSHDTSPFSGPVTTGCIALNAVDHLKSGDAAFNRLRNDRLKRGKVHINEHRTLGEEVARNPARRHVASRRTWPPSPGRIEVSDCTDLDAIFVVQTEATGHDVSWFQHVVLDVDANWLADVH